MAINIDSSTAGVFTLRPPATGGGYSLTFPVSPINTSGLSTGPTGALFFTRPSVPGFNIVINNTGTNSTNFVTSLSAVNGSINQDIALVRKSANSPWLMLSVPSGTSTGGNARGTNSIDLQFSRSNAIYVAGGNFSALVGTSDCGVTSSRSIVLGSESTYVNGSSGNNASLYMGINGLTSDPSTSGFKVHAAGGGILPDSFRTAFGAFNLVGPGFSLSGTSPFAHVMGVSFSSSDANTAISKRQVLFARSTTNTAVPMTTDGNATTATNVVSFTSANFCCMYVQLRIVATVEQAAAFSIGDTACWLLEFYCYKLSGTGSVVLTSVTNTKLFGDAGTAGWSVTLGANTTLGNGGPLITCTGQLTTNIRWMGYLDIVEMNAASI